jgi:hypothetical protein
MCDKYIGGLFVENGFSPIEREHLFYMVCIFFRLFLAGIVYNFSDNKYIQYSLLFFSLIGVYLNYSKLDECVWWSRKFHLIIASAILIITLLTISKTIDPNKYAAYLLYFDVLFGIVYSMKADTFIK